MPRPTHVIRHGSLSSLPAILGVAAPPSPPPSAPACSWVRRPCLASLAAAPGAWLASRARAVSGAEGEVHDEDTEAEPAGRVRGMQLRSGILCGRACSALHLPSLRQVARPTRVHLFSMRRESTKIAARLQDREAEERSGASGASSSGRAIGASGPESILRPGWSLRRRQASQQEGLEYRAAAREWPRGVDQAAGASRRLPDLAVGGMQPSSRIALLLVSCTRPERRQAVRNRSH
jgi:hypothetical protein